MAPRVSSLIHNVFAVWMKTFGGHFLECIQAVKFVMNDILSTFTATFQNLFCGQQTISSCITWCNWILIRSFHVADCFLFVSHGGQIREPTVNVNLTLPSGSGNVSSPSNDHNLDGQILGTHCNCPLIHTFKKKKAFLSQVTSARCHYLYVLHAPVLLLCSIGYAYCQFLNQYGLGVHSRILLLLMFPLHIFDHWYHT